MDPARLGTKFDCMIPDTDGLKFLIAVVWKNY